MSHYLSPAHALLLLGSLAFADAGEGAVVSRDRMPSVADRDSSVDEAVADSRTSCRDLDQALGVPLA